jgi:4-hydroxy-4-methyl-2-oxoglutarate aldolase
MTQQSFVERFSALDTATLYESGARATMNSEIKALSGDRRLVGQAFPIMCPPGDNLMIHVGVARASEGDVLVVQCHDHSYGVWGEVLTVSAIARGIAGVIIDGSVRDLGAIRKLNFPLFARGTALRGAEKAARGTVGEVITCAGAPVWPGDLIVADESGIVIMRAHESDQILAKAEERGRKELVLMEELRTGQTTMELLGLHGRYTE